MMLVSCACGDVTGLDPLEAHPVFLLFPIAKVENHVGHLFDILWKLHLFVLQFTVELTDAILDIQYL